jgi:hypothetical protein
MAHLVNRLGRSRQYRKLRSQIGDGKFPPVKLLLWITGYQQQKEVQHWYVGDEKMKRFLVLTYCRAETGVEFQLAHSLTGLASVDILAKIIQPISTGMEP